MTDAEWIQTGAGAVRGYLSQINAIVEKAARTDEKGVWGVDPWITIVHDLIDLQIRTAAQGAQLGLAGPWWLKPVDREPAISVPIDVPPEPYPRILSVAQSFERVGRKGARLPDGALAFTPPILPAGATSFQIKLTDYNYIGANYSGKVGFRRVDASTNVVPQPSLSVTIGL